MTPRALALAALPLAALWPPAHAAGNAPGPAWIIWPEREVRAAIIELDCRALRDCCGIHRACGDGYQRHPDPQPAPVPLPPTGPLLLAPLAAIVLFRKG